MAIRNKLKAFFFNAILSQRKAFLCEKNMKTGRRKEMHQKKSTLNTMLFLTLTLLCTTALLLMPIQTQAASKRTKKQAQRAYRNFLYESDYRSFKLIDMNRDGLKELVVSYEDSQTMVSQIIVYTYKNAAVQRAGDHYSAFGIRYNKKTKRLYGSRGGGGGIENWYYTLATDGSLKQVYLQAIERGYHSNGLLCDYYDNGKKITKAKYRRKLKKWTKHSSPLRLHKMSMQNIRKQVKM